MIKSVIIVLGAAQTSDGKPSDAMTRRVESACAYAYELGGADLILTGGRKNGNAYSEAALMAEIAIAQGISEDRLFLEEKSQNTYENARFSKAILEKSDWESVYVLSDSLHLERARVAFHAMDVKACYLPANKSNVADSTAFLYRLRELIAVMWYKIKL